MAQRMLPDFGAPPSYEFTNMNPSSVLGLPLTINPGQIYTKDPLEEMMPYEDGTIFSGAHNPMMNDWLVHMTGNGDSMVGSPAAENESPALTNSLSWAASDSPENFEMAPGSNTAQLPPAQAYSYGPASFRSLNAGSGPVYPPQPTQPPKKRRGRPPKDPSDTTKAPYTARKRKTNTASAAATSQTGSKAATAEDVAKITKERDEKMEENKSQLQTILDLKQENGELKSRVSDLMGENGELRSRISELERAMGGSHSQNTLAV